MGHLGHVPVEHDVGHDGTELGPVEACILGACVGNFLNFPFLTLK